MASEQKLAKLRDLVKNFNKKNDTEKLATLLMVPRLLDGEDVGESDLQTLFSSIGFKFINKLLRSKGAEGSCLYREVAVCVLLKYTLVPAMAQDPSMLENIPVLCHIICCHGNNEKETVDIGDLSIGDNAHKSASDHATSPSALKDSCLRILSGLLAGRTGVEGVLANVACVSKMMVACVDDLEDDSGWKKCMHLFTHLLTTTHPSLITPTHSSHLAPILVHLSHRVFHCEPTKDSLMAMDLINNMMPHFNHALVSELKETHFFDTLIQNLQAIHASKIAQGEKDKCLELSCKVVMKMGVECFMLNNKNNKINSNNNCINNSNNNSNNNNTKNSDNNSTNNSTNNSGNNNTSTRRTNSDRWGFFNLLLRLVSMEIQLSLDADHPPDEEMKGGTLGQCVVLLECLLLHGEAPATDFVEDCLYEIMHHALAYFRELRLTSEEEVGWWQRLLLRYLLAYMSGGAEAMDEEVLRELPCVLSLCSLVCRDGPGEVGLGGDEGLRKRISNNSCNVELLRMLLPALGHLTHVEEVMVMMTSTLHGREVMMMILNMFVGNLKRWNEGLDMGGARLCNLMVCDILCNIIFEYNNQSCYLNNNNINNNNNNNKNNNNILIELNIFEEFVLFMMQILPSANEGKLTEMMSTGDLVGFVACCLLVVRHSLTIPKMRKECVQNFSAFVHKVMARYESQPKRSEDEEDNDDAYNIILKEVQFLI